jgi:nucleotide-binding universal stress UspA family protein
LHLMRVIQFPALAGESQSRAEAPASRQALAKAQAYLKTVKERLQADGLHVTMSVMANIDVAHALIDAAELGAGMAAGQGAHGCDVIAMATHGRSGLGRWMMGSVSERVLGATRLPLFIVRPDKAEAQTEEARAGISELVASKGL